VLLFEGEAGKDGEWECARFIYPRYELLYELRRVETAATAGTAVMHQQVTNKHQPPGLS
jgi:hypothetical protein